MATLLSPVMSGSPSGTAMDFRPISPDSAKNSNFADYMEKKLNAGRREGGNLLSGPRAPAAERRRTPEAAEPEDRSKDEMTTVATLLQQFIQEMQKMAAEEKNGSGDWTVCMMDRASLEKIAGHGGIEESQLAALIEQLERNGGKMALDDFLAVFVRRFEEKQELPAVTVPETELPFLQILLERFGVPPEEVERIGVQAVRGDNSLDLTKFLEAVEGATGEHQTKLSDLEAEQLQNLLAEAGVSERLQRALLPERYPAWQATLPEGGREMTMTLARLKSLLQHGVEDVNASRGTIDPAAFLQDLHDILSQAGFEEKGSGWSPAVQEALSAIYDRLLESVDFSRLQVKKLDQPLGDEPFVDAELPVEGVALETTAAAGEGKKVEAATTLDKGEELAGTLMGKETVEENLIEENGQPQPQAPEAAASESTFAHSGEASGKGDIISPQEAKAVHVPRSPLPTHLQQQALDQISQGVLRGLRNNEHHLILKLHPPELGEVKVEMLVRDEHVALSFSMENSRVKGILEGNMEQFRGSLEKQGFVLGECMVSVSQDEGGEQAWKEFEFAWRSSGLGDRREVAAVPGQGSLYLQPSGQSASAGGIDLFA